MSNPFSSQSIGTAGPAIGAIVITPSDGANLSSAIRAVTIGAASGTLSFISSRDGQTITPDICQSEPMPFVRAEFRQRARARLA